MPTLETKVWLALATIYLVWGSTFMAVTVAVRDLPPFLSMGIRHLIAGSLLLAWALPRGDRAGDRIGPRQLGAAAIFGGALFLGGHGGLAWAQQTVPSGVSALLMGSIPLWVALLDRVVFGKRLHRLAGSRARDRLPGTRIAARSFRRGAHRPKRRGSRALRWVRLGGGVALLARRAAPAATDRGCRARRPLRRRPPHRDGGGERRARRGALHAGSITAVAYLVVFGTLLGFSAYVWLLRAAPTSLVATYAYVNPIVAVFLGWALLGEKITLSMLAAGAAIVVSVALIVATSNRVTEPGRGLRRSTTKPVSELRPPP